MLLRCLTSAQGQDCSPFDSQQVVPALATLDFLGRMPVPLRHGFAAGLDQAVSTASRSAARLQTSFLMGNEWYAPFADLLAAEPGTGFPKMILSPLTRDMLSIRFQQRLRAAGHRAMPAAPALSPAVIAAGLDDPAGLFSVFAIIPWVMLIDHRRLGRRPVPRRWQDLLDPVYQDRIVFGGWQNPLDGSYDDCNDYLLLNLYRFFGRAGVQSFAANVTAILHNTTAARIAGTDDDRGGAIYILPWMQADICPRRDRTSVIWPDDGAMAMPIGCSTAASRQARLQPLIDFVRSDPLGGLLTKNRYPPVWARFPTAMPAGGKLKWLGWDYTRSHDMEAETAVAKRIFFAAWPRTAA